MVQGKLGWIEALALVGLLAMGLPLMARGAEQTLVSGFQGSTAVAAHQSRFGSLPVLVPPMDAQKVPNKVFHEGVLDSRVFQRPENVAAIEVTKSYAQALQADGFEVLLQCERARANCKSSYIVSSNYNELLKARDYPGIPRDTRTWLTFYAHHYLSARKQSADGVEYVVIIVSDKNGLYLVDTLKVAAMQQDSVQITTKLLDDKLSNEGKVVLSGIFFATGSDKITDASQPALATIAGYLKEHADQAFYVVGHTDDTGVLETNLALSSQRAQAVAHALAGLGVDAAKLRAQGVGPFAPAASNESEVGKASNRRVELVLRLGR